MSRVPRALPLIVVFLVGLVAGGGGVWRAVGHDAQASPVRGSLDVVRFGADPSGGVDSAPAFKSAYAAAGPGQPIVIPYGQYLMYSWPVPDRGKSVVWLQQGSGTVGRGGDLPGLIATGTMLSLPNVSGHMTLAERGSVLEDSYIYGGDGIPLLVMSKGSAMLGYTDAVDQPMGSFPVATSGVFKQRTPGAGGFGMYAESHLNTNGSVAGMEVDAFNDSGQPPSSILPPQNGFGTTEHVPISLLVGGGSGVLRDGAPNPVSLGIFVAKSGAGMLTGYYSAPDATLQNGMVLDATAGVGPAFPLTVNMRAGANPVRLVNQGPFSAASPLQTWSAGGALRIAAYQDGTLESNGAYRLGGDGSLALSGPLSVAGPVTLPLGTPVSSTAECLPGQRLADERFDYVCVARNRWKRAALASW